MKLACLEEVVTTNFKVAVPNPLRALRAGGLWNYNRGRVILHLLGTTGVVAGGVAVSAGAVGWVGTDATRRCSVARLYRVGCLLN